MTRNGGTYNNESGFSLVELMIVVAILGILATIAIPNFQRFQARAKQKSGQMMLSSYYVAMKATHAEYTHYFGDFVAVGFRPEGEIAYHLMSMNQAPDPGFPLGLPREPSCYATLNNCTTPGYVLGVNWTAGPSASIAIPGGSVTRNSFEAWVGADLNAGGVIDTWRIDHNRNLINTIPGIPQ